MSDRKEREWTLPLPSRRSSSASSGSPRSVRPRRAPYDAIDPDDERDADTGTSEPVWKTNLLVLTGLYPLVLLHTVFVAPHLRFLGEAVAILFGSATTVAFLGWPVLPWLRRTFGWWLAPGSAGARSDARGAAVLAVMVATTVLLFVHVVQRLI